MTRTSRAIRIGGASGAWGDSPLAVGQLIGASVDYLMMDYLAEVTMSLLAKARARDADAGYPRDFVRYVVPHLGELAERGTKIVTNAGGVNPMACKRALEDEIAMAGLDLRVAVVLGDDVLPSLHSGLSVPGQDALDRNGLLSANAYLGAFPIARALDQGADIVITGRCADSSLALGVLVHEFDWRPDDHDLLAAGSLVGHIIECGPQATGGNFTDWEDVPDWHNIGYPIAECQPDGSFAITKPADTGGLIDVRCIKEQLLYEIGDPAAYVLPDVVADFTQVEVVQADPERVVVRGAKGRPPTTTYKVSATSQAGYRAAASFTLIGPDAARKAQRTGEQFLERGSMILGAHGWAPYTSTRIEVIGAESAYGARSTAWGSREVVLRVVMTHPNADALDRIGLEVGSVGLGFAPGVAGINGGRPRATPQIVLSTLFIEKRDIPAPVVVLGDADPLRVEIAHGEAARPAPVMASRTTTSTPVSGDTVAVQLRCLAHARSGDKGDLSNVAIVARRPEYLPIIAAAVTEDRMADHFSGQVSGPVRRYDAPGVHAVNFVMEQALGGGGMASLRIDPQGKAYGQMALEMAVDVPADLARAEGWQTL